VTLIFCLSAIYHLATLSSNMKRQLSPRSGLCSSCPSPLRSLECDLLCRQHWQVSVSVWCCLFLRMLQNLDIWHLGGQTLLHLEKPLSILLLSHQEIASLLAIFLLAICHQVNLHTLLETEVEGWVLV